MSRDGRIVRYGAAGVVIVAGFACAVALTGSLANSLATVLIGAGMVALLGFLLRDLGITGAPDRSPDRRRDPPPRADASARSNGHLDGTEPQLRDRE